MLSILSNLLFCSFCFCYLYKADCTNNNKIVITKNVKFLLGKFQIVILFCTMSISFYIINYVTNTVVLHVVSFLFQSYCNRVLKIWQKVSLWCAKTADDTIFLFPVTHKRKLYKEKIRSTHKLFIRNLHSQKKKKNLVKGKIEKNY